MSLERGPGGTAISHSKELLSLAYIQSLITVTGLNFLEPEIDNYGVDIQIVGKNFSGHYPKPQMDVQLKCAQKSAIRIDKKTKELGRVDLS